MAARTWFITGTSRGFGREWARAALERGDRVAATARDVTSLDELVAVHGDAVLPIALDVTDRTEVRAAVDHAVEHFGRLDIVVNNAGYGLFGMVEELTEGQARAPSSRPTCSAPCGSRRRRCRTCGRAAAATSCRCRRSEGSPRSPASGSTTRRSGPSRG
jgi:NAD(P)-dependent dehydrogenase (short-subunit alcohol dehydrogenase family)